jgi:hypothetical protein
MHNLASQRDTLQCHLLACKNTDERCKTVVDAPSQFIYEWQYAVDRFKCLIGPSTNAGSTTPDNVATRYNWHSVREALDQLPVRSV